MFSFSTNIINTLGSPGATGSAGPPGFPGARGTPGINGSPGEAGIKGMPVSFDHFCDCSISNYSN